MKLDIGYGKFIEVSEGEKAKTDGGITLRVGIPSNDVKITDIYVLQLSPMERKALKAAL